MALNCVLEMEAAPGIELHEALEQFRTELVQHLTQIMLADQTICKIRRVPRTLKVNYSVWLYALSDTDYEQYDYIATHEPDLIVPREDASPWHPTMF